MSRFDHNIKTYTTSVLSKSHLKWPMGIEEVIPADRKSRSQKPQVYYTSSVSHNETLSLQKAMTEIAQLAASALLPFSDSKTLDTISSTDDQIDDVKSDNEQPE